MLLNEPSLNTCDEAELKNMKEKNLFYQQVDCYFKRLIYHNDDFKKDKNKYFNSY